MKASLSLVLMAVLLIFPSLNATTVNLYDLNIELPFPEEWLAKGSEKKNSFVFFNPKDAPPRLMISLYASSFKYPRNDLSDFEQVLREKKLAWLKKIEGKATNGPQIAHNQAKKSVFLKFPFESPQGTFEEWTHFEECKNGKGVVLKAMIPVSKLKNFKSEHEQFFASKSLCQN